MRLIGLDPGLQHTGWGIVDASGNHVRYVDCGRISTTPADYLAVRLDRLYRGLSAIIQEQAPDCAAIEETVVNRNPSSSLKLGHARGVAMLAAAHAGLPVCEYASKTVKRAVVGTGAAQKQQVMMMVRTLLPGAGAMAEDAADALAVALCHAQHSATGLRVASAVV